MGREIRRVPPNWKHPKKDESYQDSLQPMYDEKYESARAEWLEGLRKWEAGEDKDRHKYKAEDGTDYDWWEWHSGPPDRQYYRPWNDDEATWYQLWETVSEGTPVSPPFETQEDLIAYLADNGDFWDQNRAKNPREAKLFNIDPNNPGWGRERAERFVLGDGWAPSMVMNDGKLMSGVEYVTQEKSK